MHMVHINPCRHIHVNKKTILNLKKKRNYVCVCVGGVETPAFSLALFTVSKFYLPETMHVLLCLIVLKK